MEARQSIDTYISFNNQRRPHSNLDGVPPETFYYNALPRPTAA
ncbi:MAG: hypothetical protein DSY87_07875 [Methylococcus sp.]|nr:MAG: hypothetical protein DSY87_07875 [Methylococcus sp.]